jgi:hypothetical protein
VGGGGAGEPVKPPVHGDGMLMLCCCVEGAGGQCWGCGVQGGRATDPPPLRSWMDTVSVPAVVWSECDIASCCVMWVPWWGKRPVCTLWLFGLAHPHVHPLLPHPQAT